MLMFLFNHLLSTPDCHPTTAPCLFHLFVLHRHSLLLRHLPTLRSIYESQHTHSHTRRPLHKCVVFFFVRITILLYCVVFLAESLLFFFPRLEVAVLKRSKLSRLGAQGKKATNKQKGQMSIARRSFDILFCPMCVYVCVCLPHAVRIMMFMKHVDSWICL